MVDKLLEQLPRERILGVILNRADEQVDSTAYYYQQRYGRRDRTLLAAEPPQLPTEQAEEVAIVN